MLIVADDLTGAADTAGAFAVAGHETVVILHRANQNVPNPNVSIPNVSIPNTAIPNTAIPKVPSAQTAVVAIDTDSRAMPESAAFDATAAAVSLHPRRPLFVKIDSTMRGHVLATVLATIAGRSASGSGVEPSRVVVCPAFPMLGRTVVRGWVCLDDVPIDNGQLGPIFAAVAATTDVVIADARSDADLDALVRANLDPQHPNATLWVGSAGLARHVAQQMGPTRGATASQTEVGGPPNRHPATKIVVVVGSQHQQTSAQVARLRADTRIVQIDPREPGHIDEILPVLIEGDGLVLTGGHTARVVLDALGIDWLRVTGEVEVGMPWSLATRAGRTISIVTKAGGFGNEMALRRAVEFLEQPS